jgi:hypothetical protein
MSAPPTGILFYEPRAKPLSVIGLIQPGAYYQFYLTGTTTLANVYADGALASPLSQTPGTGGTTAASDGRLVPIYLNPATTYRVQLYSVLNTLLEDVDPYIPQPIIPLYPQTAAEQSAGVTPVNLTYPPFNLLRYGASSGGTSLANTTAMINAIAVVGSSGGEIIIPAGTYALQSDVITFPHTNVTVTGAGSGMGYGSPTAGTTLVFGSGTIGFDMTARTGAEGAGNYTLLRQVSVSGNNLCQYPIKIEGKVLLEHINVTGSTAAGAGIWLFDLVNSTILSWVSAIGNNGYGIAIGGLGAGTGQNTIMSLNNCTIRGNLIGIRIEQAVQLTLRDTVIESNINEGMQIYQRHLQNCANLEFDTIWFENNWAGGTSSNYNLTIDSFDQNFGGGPPQYVKFINSKFSATGVTGAINIQSCRYARFENCFSTNGITLGAFASYTGFYNLNGGTITDGGNRTWIGKDDDSFIGGPNYTGLVAQRVQIGNSGSSILAKVKGTTLFSAAGSVAVVFPIALSSATYQVALSQSASSALPPWVTAKATTGFTINFSVSVSLNVDWIVEQ